MKSGEQAIFEAAVATEGIDPEPALLARIIETDGTVFVAQEWGRDDDGFIIATGSFAGTQEHLVTVLIPFRSVRRIVVEEAA